MTGATSGSLPDDDPTFLATSLEGFGLTEADLATITQDARSERYAPGTTILQQGGAPADAFFVIRDGAVEVVVDGAVVDVPGPGEMFGELSLLAGTGPTATVRAKGLVECLLLGRESATRLLGTAGGVAFVQASLRRSLTSALDTDGRALLDAIRSAEGREEAIAAASALPATTRALIEDGADAVKVGRVIGTAIDTLARRMLGFAQDDLGPAPVPWAWLALGSEARLEQALHTDQDHALAFDPGDLDPASVDPYFAELAERVTAGLEAAGIPRCKGDAMAVHSALRRPLTSWQDAIREWMADPGVDGSILSSILFDFRQIDGPLAAEPSLHAVVATASTHYPQFLRHLTRRALDRRPPTGFFGHLVVESKGEHAGRLDIKHGGVTIVSNLARAYTIAGGGAENGTIDRLQAAEARGQLDAERRQGLTEAFRLLWQIRLEHQSAQVERGEEADDFVDPGTLGPIARRGLKESFKILAHEQQMLASDLGVDP